MLILMPKRDESADPEETRTLHCRFRCKHCSCPIWIPHDRLGHPFSDPPIQVIEAKSIATVCCICYHVGRYSLYRDNPDYSPGDTMVIKEPLGETVLVDQLRCEETSCNSELRLFVDWFSGIPPDGGKELAKEWKWAGLKCSEGHPIRIPQWLSSNNNE